MPNVDDALSTVEAYRRAWTSGDVDLALTYVSDVWYFPQTTATTTTLASELVTVHEGQIVEIRLAFDRLGYIPQQRQPA